MVISASRVAAIAAAAFALALVACEPPRTGAVAEPPERFRHKLGPASIIIEPGETVKCLIAGEGLVDGYACTSAITKATRAANPCLYPGEVYAEALCHDIVGHQLNSWPANHPD